MAHLSNTEKKKQKYLAPEIEILVTITEGVLAGASPVPPGGGAGNSQGGGTVDDNVKLPGQTAKESLWGGYTTGEDEEESNSWGGWEE